MAHCVRVATLDIFISYTVPSQVFCTSNMNPVAEEKLSLSALSITKLK